ncbi:MAG: galactose mutarotase [Clostridia bacterium]|nr:galactose mutarotase [Clostridia bacterium]
MEKKLFGYMPDGCKVYSYTLKNGKMEAEIVTLGGIIRRLVVNGTDVVMGFDTVEGMLTDTSNQGALIGRYGNRIKDAHFFIDGKEYKLFVNTGKNNHLHGGKYGFNRKLWTAEEKGENELVLTYLSPDGEENYPGNLDVKVTYTLYEDAIGIHYEAVSDKDTFVNLTNHAYFNLNGGDGSKILDHVLQINADTFTDVDDELIPVGRKAVEGTMFDFRTPKRIGQDLHGTVVTDPDFGYDHNFNLTGKVKETYDGKELNVCAVLTNGKITMTTLTDQMGVQFYSANFLEDPNVQFKGGVELNRRMALCLETQFEPDAPTRGENLLKAGDKYETVTVYRFA